MTQHRNLLDPLPEPEGDPFPDLDELAAAIEEDEANILSTDDEGDDDDGEIPE